MKHLLTLEEFNEAISANTLCVIDFYAQWCGPCKRLAPRYEELSKEHKSAHFYKVDVDEAGEIASKCKINALPTFKFYRNGEELESFEGANAERLEDTIVRLNQKDDVVNVYEVREKKEKRAKSSH